MSSQTFSTFSEVGMIDARGQNGIITLPLTTDIPYRILTLKDIYGAAALSSITLTTQGADVFEDGTTSRLLNGAFETTTLYAGQAGFWYVTGGSRLATAAIGLLSTGVIANPLRLGTLSTQTAIQFPGLRAGYTGTVVAGQGTGVGTQELLLYQASSISDQIRLQTTGNIVFEAGAAARSWPSTAALVTPTLYIAGTTSNVGIGTASPATTLDVAGTGRFQVVSTQALTVSTINGQTFGQPINSTVIGLGTAGYISSSQLNSTVSGLIITAASAFTGSTVSLSSGSVYASNITMSGTVNMCNNAISNVSNTVFSYPTSSFLPTSITGCQLWLDAADPTVFTYSSGSNISAWADKSSNANNLTVTNSYGGTVPPTRLVDGSITVVNFPGTSILQGTKQITYTATSAFFIVMRATTTPTGIQNIFSFPSVASACALRINPSGLNGTASQTGDVNDVGNGTYYVNGSFNPSNLTVGTVTTNYVLINTINPTTPGGPTDIIFGGQFASQRYYIGNIAEFLYYPGGVTSNQRLSIEGYLAWKWSINTLLPSSNPYYSSPPAVSWVALGNVTYDTTSNLKITATNAIRLASAVQIPTTLTASSFTVSSINGQTFGQPIQSTVIGLGTAGYVSTSQLYSTVTGIGQGFTGSTLGLSAATIGVSTINMMYLSSVQGYVSSLRTDSLTVGGPTGYVTIQDLTTGTVSTGQVVAGAGFISSLQINTLSFGPSGYVIVSNFIAASLSTQKLNAQNAYVNNLYVGNTSTQSAILFPGVDGAYKGTAIAEQVTGVGTEELLLYKVSTATDQIRLQTTGNIVFEAGAAARSWPSTAALATPTLYIQGSTSNVGVGTAAPATTLDVAGTGRFQVLSSYTLNVSSINGILPGAAFNGSTTALSTALITTSTLLTNSVKASTLTMYGTLNMLNNPLTNIYSILFAPIYSGNPNVSAGGLYTTYGSGISAYAVHVFTFVGTTVFAPIQTITGANILLIAGGGGGGQWIGGGGGAGGFIALSSQTITNGSYNIVVGAGGIGATLGVSAPQNGGNTSAFNQIAIGGGYGAGYNQGSANSGGSGGGAAYGQAAASGTSGQGFAGGSTDATGMGGGGGGAGGAGGVGNGTNAGSGGIGIQSGITGTLTYYAGGGGGATNQVVPSTGLGGLGGGGNGANGADGTPGSNATYYGGGGGGGTRNNGTKAGDGYQGIAIISYPTSIYSQNAFTVGSITGDVNSNLSIQPVNNLNIVGTTQTSALLIASTFSTTFINAATVSAPALQVSSINGSTITNLIAPTSNYFRNLLALNVSSAVSTATLYTSNTSNYLLPALSNNLSSAASTLALYTTTTSNYFQNLLALNVSSAISTATLYTSNTSNFILSTNQSSISTAFVTAIQGYISSLVVDSLAIGSNSGFINMGDVITTSHSTLQLNTGLLTASGTVCTPQIIVSSINGQQPLTLANLTSTVTGTNSNISSMIDPTELTSTVTGLGTANFISSVGLTTILTSTVTGVNTTIAAMIDPIELASSITGLGTVGFISSIGLDAKFASTTQGLGTAGYVSSLSNVTNVSTLNINVSTINGQTFGQPINSTVIGLGTAGYASTSYVIQQISSLSTAMGQVGASFSGSTISLSAGSIYASSVSTVQFWAQNVNAQAVSTNALIFGTGTGTLLMPDIAPNTVYTSTVTTSNVQVGWSSNQSPLQFYGYGTYSNTAIVEQSTGTTTQELLVFRGSNAADRIRFQTTGYMAIETGVSYRYFGTALSNVVPAVMIDINSNVGIKLASPAYPLDVGGTARAITLSSLTIQTSTIEGAIFTKDLYANTKTFLQGEVSTSFLLGNYNTLTFKTAGTQRATFTQAGNLGIGVADPQFPVDIAGITRVSTIYNSTSISYNFISAPLLVTSTVNTVNIQITNTSSGQINTSTIYGRWNDAQYYVLQTL